MTIQILWEYLQKPFKPVLQCFKQKPQLSVIFIMVTHIYQRIMIWNVRKITLLWVYFVNWIL